MKRVIWKAINGSSHTPDEARVCQKGSAPEAAIDCHARPIKPETGESSRPLVKASQIATGGVILGSFRSIGRGRHTEDLVGYRKPCQLNDVLGQDTLCFAASIGDRKGGGQVGEGARLRGVESVHPIAAHRTQ